MEKQILITRTSIIEQAKGGISNWNTFTRVSKLNWFEAKNQLKLKNFYKFYLIELWSNLDNNDPDLIFEVSKN